MVRSDELTGNGYTATEELKFGGDNLLILSLATLPEPDLPTFLKIGFFLLLFQLKRFDD